MPPLSAGADGVAVEAAKITAELGVSVLKEASTDADFSIPASTLPSGLRSEKLETSLSKYVNLRNAYTSAKSGTDTLASVTEAVTGISAVAMYIPGIVLGSILRGSVELGNQSLDEYAKKRSRDYLIGVADQLVKESGVADFEALVQDPKLIEKTLVNSSMLLNDVRLRAQQANDPALLATVAASIAQVADAKAVAAYNLASDAAVDIAKLDTEFSRFANFVDEEFKKANARFDNHERRLVDLEADVGGLEVAVGEMRTQIGRLGRNQDLIADFVFTRMTPAERVGALESGLLDGRIQCPKDAPACDKNVVRTAMIARYSKEAQIQETLKSIGGVVVDANTSLKIANDLGLDVPKEISTAVNVATAGFNAFANFTAGNYLGAISSITGLFGGQKDAGAERHKQMMEYLRKNFEQTNKRLDALREGVVQVSEQIHALHVDMDARFRALDFRLDLIDRQLRQLIWEPWASCNTVANYARFPPEDPSLSFVDRQTLFFTDFRSRVAVLNADEGAVRTCMRVMNDGLGAVASLDGWTRFGAFVDLERSLLDLSPEQVDRLEKAIEEEGAVDYRPLLPKYLDSIVKPSSSIVRAWGSREGLDGGTLLYLLAAAPETMTDLDSVLEVVFPVEGRIIRTSPMEVISYIGWPMQEWRDFYSILPHFSILPHLMTPEPPREDGEFVLDGEGWVRWVPIEKLPIERNEDWWPHSARSWDYVTCTDFSDIYEQNCQIKLPKEEGWRFRCDDQEDPRYALIGGAICRTDEVDALVDAHLKSALDTETLIEVSEWAVIASQILDLHDGANDSFARSFPEVESIEAGGAGQRLMRTLAPLITLGVAYENRLHGGLTAWIIADDIQEGRADSDHRRILEANPYLAENVAMILLKAAREAPVVGVSLENRHAQAILHSRAEEAFPFGPLKALYGDARVFELDDYGRPAMIVNVGGSDIALPLPGPKQLEEGRFILPIEHSNLLAARERVVERVIDYEIGADADLVRTLVAVR